MSGFSQWASSHKPQVGAMAAAAVVVIVVAIVAASGVFAPPAQQPEQQEAQTVDVTLNVTADSGWKEDSTPAIAHIQGGGVDYYHAVAPDAEGNKGSSSIALAEGDYSVSFISPVNSDGSVFDIYETGKPVDITVDANADTALVVDCPMTLIPAGQVTDEVLQGIVGKIEEAIENGDGTLKGDAGKSILDKLEGNVAQNPNASDETKQEATDAEREVDVDSAPAETTSSATTGSGTGNQPSAAGSSGSASAGVGGSSSSSSQASQSTHTHTWVDHTTTRQVWVSNWVDVPDYTTQKTIVGTNFIFSYDGYTTSDIQDAKSHAVELVRANLPENYHTEAIYETQTVQTGSHKEDQGHYETETYVDYVYCSSCGALQ